MYPLVPPKRIGPWHCSSLTPPGGAGCRCVRTSARAPAAARARNPAPARVLARARARARAHACSCARGCARASANNCAADEKEFALVLAAAVVHGIPEPIEVNDVYVGHLAGFKDLLSTHFDADYG